MNLNPNQRIFDVVQDIGRGLYRIPSIQRGYEWNRERVLKLLDSIMNGYPIGAIMVWNPLDELRKEIPTRPFILEYDSRTDYFSAAPHEAHSNDSYFVLDGQQRLQSLYIAFMGSYDDERVYMQMDYQPTEGVDGDFGFEFLTHSDAKKHPSMIQLSSIIKLDSDTKFAFIEKLSRDLTQNLKGEQVREQAFKLKQTVIGRNIDRFVERFNMKASLLLQEVEQRQDYDHVLEIFERVNSAGMVLSKSDLLFSTLKLKLHEMEGKFATSLSFLNQGDRHNFNTDFLIKSALVILGQRAKYEVKKLRDDKFAATLQERYGDINTCLRQMLAWLDDVALIKCSRFLRSQLALIPILDFMLLSKQMDKPDGENARAMREYLYMSFLLRTYSRSSDAVLDKIHELLEQSVKNDPKKFPIDRLRIYMAERRGANYEIQNQHFADDPDLMLNIVDGGVLQIDPSDPKRHPKDLKLEVDHIFPRAPLTKMGLEDVVNHIGNYRLLVMPANRRKMAKLPDQTTAFFGRDDKAVEDAYQDAQRELNRESFLRFRDARAALIQRRVMDFLGLPTVPRS